MQHVARNMQHVSRHTTLSLLVAAISLLTVACGQSPDSGSVTASPAEVRLSVVASISPLADFARQVGGERVRVTTLIPPGTSPHTYVLTPVQAVTVSKAHVLVLNGIGLEFWADKVIDVANNPHLVVVDASQGIPVLAGDEDESGGNPHVWLNPRYAIRQVERIREGLIQADPAGRAAYEANAAAYIASLEALDAEIERQVSGWSQKAFVAFHPSFAYFAQRYGLVQAAVIETAPGREPSPTQLTGVIAIVRGINARAIFAEPQLSAKAVETIAGESGVQVLYLDPLGSRVPSHLYTDLIQYNVSQLAQALQ